jgi:hypothetical protein
MTFIKGFLHAAPPSQWRTLAITLSAYDRFLPELCKNKFSSLETLNVEGFLGARMDAFSRAIDKTAVQLRTLAVSDSLTSLQRRLSKTLKRITTLYLRKDTRDDLGGLPPNIHTITTLQVYGPALCSAYITSLTTTYPFNDLVDLPNLQYLSITTRFKIRRPHSPVFPISLPNLREMVIRDYPESAITAIAAAIIAPLLRDLTLDFSLGSQSEGVTEIITEILCRGRPGLDNDHNNTDSIIYPALASLVIHMRLDYYPLDDDDLMHDQLVDALIREWAQALLHRRRIHCTNAQPGAKALSNIRCKMGDRPYTIDVHLDALPLQAADKETGEEE